MIARDLSSPFVVSLADVRERRPRERRTCAHDGCGTILSQYNDSAYCSAHAPEPEVYEHLGYYFRTCRCGEVYQVHKSGGSPLCPACKRYVLRWERDARRKTKSLRKDGRPDAVQKAQGRVSALSPKGLISYREKSA